MHCFWALGIAHLQLGNRFQLPFTGLTLALAYALSQRDHSCTKTKGQNKNKNQNLEESIEKKLKPDASLRKLCTADQETGQIWYSTLDPQSGARSYNASEINIITNY